MDDLDDQVIRVRYRNHRGVVSVRRIIPHSLRFGATTYHPEQQWLMKAYCLEKRAFRDFALKDFEFLPKSEKVGV